MITRDGKIDYFENYLMQLDAFMYKELGSITVKEYMGLVREKERVKLYIKDLENVKTSDISNNIINVHSGRFDESEK